MGHLWLVLKPDYPKQASILKRDGQMDTRKALLRFPSKRDIAVSNCPLPDLTPGSVLVRTSFSVLSNGTEAQQDHQTRLSLISKAWQRPDLVALVIDKLRRDGLQATRNAVRNRLERPLAAGYASTGVVCAVGRNVNDIEPGMRVACAGIGFASHADYNVVPRNLLCPVPDTVTDEAAAFTTLCSIALHAIRQGEIAIGHTIAIIGCGLIGQLAIQCATAAGAKVIAIDPDGHRQTLAQNHGATETFASSAEISPKNLNRLTKGLGCDAVLVCAPDPSGYLISEAAKLCRDRGIIVCVGNVAIKALREPLYRKEITLRQVRSYGPGRYDPEYEIAGHDYPPGYVRWTLNRNMQAALDLMARQKIAPETLIEDRVPFEALPIGKTRSAGSITVPLATLVTYPSLSNEPFCAGTTLPGSQTTADKEPDTGLAAISPITLGMIGAGNYAGSTLWPLLIKRSDVKVKAISSQSGLSALALANRTKDVIATETSHILDDRGIKAIIVTTRHDSHADLAIAALQAGKHVWVEKPLAVTLDQIEALDQTVRNLPPDNPPLLMVGHNRRLAPMTHLVSKHLPEGPAHFSYHVHPAPLADDHWLRRSEQGGRALGEISHFIDLICHLSRSPLKDLSCHWIDRAAGDCVWRMTFENGSRGEIHYIEKTRKRQAKETLVITARATSIKMVDWRILDINTRSGHLRRRNRFRPNKGQEAALAYFLDHIQTASPDEIMQANRAEVSLWRKILGAAYGVPA